MLTATLLVCACVCECRPMCILVCLCVCVCTRACVYKWLMTNIWLQVLTSAYRHTYQNLYLLSKNKFSCYAIFSYVLIWIAESFSDNLLITKRSSHECCVFIYVCVGFFIHVLWHWHSANQSKEFSIWKIVRQRSWWQKAIDLPPPVFPSHGKVFSFTSHARFILASLLWKNRYGRTTIQNFHPSPFSLSILNRSFDRIRFYCSAQQLRPRQGHKSRDNKTPHGSQQDWAVSMTTRQTIAILLEARQVSH